MKQFPCTGCGQCCRMVGKSAAAFQVMKTNRHQLEKHEYEMYKTYSDAFEGSHPHEKNEKINSYVQLVAKEDGSCVHLGEDNKCTVYDKRPVICRVEEMYYIQAKMQAGKKGSKPLQKSEYYLQNATACNTMQIAANIGEEFRVRVK